MRNTLVYEGELFGIVESLQNVPLSGIHFSVGGMVDTHHFEKNRQLAQQGASNGCVGSSGN